MKTLIISILLLLPLQGLLAQDARTILNKVSEKLLAMQGAEATFMVSMVQDGKYSAAEKGQIDLKGHRFKLQAGGITTWFDGKTQWSYVKANDEVSVSQPDEVEQQAINPYTFLSLYQQGYKLSMTSPTLDGKSVWEVTMLAEKKSQSIWQMVVSVDKTTYQPIVIKIRQANEAWIIIRLTSMKKNPWPDSHFTFTKADAPNAEIIDLR